MKMMDKNWHEIIINSVNEDKLGKQDNLNIIADFIADGIEIINLVRKKGFKFEGITENIERISK